MSPISPLTHKSSLTSPTATDAAPRQLPQGHSPEAEAYATEVIAKYLNDSAINPYKGSVPVERIQNIFRGRHAELYDAVVGSKHSAWKRYIERNSDIFAYFSVEEGKWRMRLLDHVDWQKGDQEEEAARDAWESHLTKALTAYLNTVPGKTSTLDAFMSAYPAMSDAKRLLDGSHYTLPHRGDLVRFIRRSSKFTYEHSTFIMGFRGEQGDAQKEERPKATADPAKDAAPKEGEKPKEQRPGLNPYAQSFQPRSEVQLEG